jgi:uncharacterized protein (TIGR02466 family)
MQVECIFCNFIARDFIDIDNNKIADFCYDRFNNNPFRDQRVPDQPSNQTWFSEEDLNQEPLKELFDIFNVKVNELHQQLGFKDDSLQIINQSWATLNNSFYTSLPHCHPGAFFTCVYYVKSVDLNSPLELINPIGAHSHVINRNVSEYNNINSSSYAEAPSPGKLVIFPSWLYHYVNNDFSTSDRISIAFNTLIVKKGEDIPKFRDT